MFYNRVAWAKFYLQKAGLVKKTKYGHFIATDKGVEVIKTNDVIDSKYLLKLDQFNKFKRPSSNPNKTDPKLIVSNQDSYISSTPDEVLIRAYDEINSSLAIELLSSIMDSSPSFFERLIVDLLVSMGYGGASDDAGRALGCSGDNGVDGVIDQDPLGVDQVYIQAKRYQDSNKVGASDIRDFFGSLSLKRATKGIFVTTSSFTSSAIKTSQDLNHRIVLIDGKELASLLIKYDIGCRAEKTIQIRKLDEDYFNPN